MGVVRELSVLAFPDSAALTMLGSAAPELLKARACHVPALTVSSVRATATSSSAEQDAT